MALFFAFYAILGFWSIQFNLLARFKAGFEKVGKEPFQEVGCVDRRVEKDIPILGGGAGFTFGLHYLVLSVLVGGELYSLFLLYFAFQFMSSAFNFWSLKGQTDHLRGVVLLKAHRQGCGFTTAWSPFWPLFWFQMFPRLGWIVYLRDLITEVDWLVSAVCLKFLNWFFWFFDSQTPIYKSEFVDVDKEDKIG